VLGHVCDKEGKKESKSKGNYTPPDVILDKVAMEFAAKDAVALGLSGAAPGVAFVCREDYEGLDLDGDEAEVEVYRGAEAPREGRRRLSLRPVKGLPRRVLALAPSELELLGLTPVAPDAKVMPSEVSTKLAAEHRVTVEDPHTPAPGADAFRWFFYAASPPWTNTRHSLTNVRTTQKDFLVRLRNVYSFFVIYANIDGVEPGALPRRPLALRSLLDRWILSELAETVRDVGAHLEAYRSYEAAQKLVAFVDGLSNWYVRRSRGRFWSSSAAPSEAERADKENAYATLYDVLVTLSRLIAPFTPFFAEELHQNLVRGPFSTRGGATAASAPESVHLAAWPEADLAAQDVELSREMRAVREVVSLGLSVRTTSRLRVRQPLSRADVVVSSEAVRRALEPHRALVADELNVKAVRLLVPGEEQGEVTYALKPNFRALGPKLGKKVQALKAVLAKADAGAIRAELAEHGVAKLVLEGEPFELVADELEVSVQAAEGFAAAGGRVGVVVLHTELDEGLRDEGLARELLSRVQGLRKDLGLGFTDRIALGLSGGPRVARVVAAHEALFRSEALAERVSGEHVPQARELEVDGESVRISVSLA
jgi:isoleucyl-tRNA synthetase